MSKTTWNRKLVRFSFWSINAGLMLMVVLDLFPAGAIQFKAVVENGFWFARSEQFIKGGTFESLTWMRGIGACVFLFGGVVPLVIFIVSRVRSLKPASSAVTLLDDVTDSEDTPMKVKA